MMYFIYSKGYYTHVKQNLKILNVIEHHHMKAVVIGPTFLLMKTQYLLPIINSCF
jgi:hypothetical protein